MSVNLKLGVVQGKVKPIIDYDNCEILFDTGADTPVWCSGLKFFMRRFPEAVKEDYKFFLSGFGRSRDELFSLVKNLNGEGVHEYLVDVYSIPEFTLESNGQQITWRNLRVAVTNREFSGVDLILPCTMFRGMVLRICQRRVNTEIEIISPKAIVNVNVKVFQASIGALLRHIYGQDDMGEITEVLEDRR